MWWYSTSITTPTFRVQINQFIDKNLLTNTNPYRKVAAFAGSGKVAVARSGYKL
jgi:hypothetical protein